MQNFPGVRTLASIGIAAVLVGTLWFLYSKTQSADFTNQNAIVADLRELEALDAESGTDSLRAKTGINRSYEAGRAPAQRIPKAIEKIEQAIAASDIRDAAGAFAAVKAAFGQKDALTRRFGEQNKILRESLLFVTDESADLLALLRVLQRDALQLKGGAAAQKIASLSELGSRVNELLTETLKYNLLSDPAALKRIQSNLDDLDGLLPQYPAELTKPLEALIAKFHGVQRQKAVEDNLLNEMAALPTQQRISDTEKTLDASRAQAQSQTDFYRSLLIGYSALLLALIAWFAWRLVASYRLIQSKNAELKDANEGLEQRVNARTMELRDALTHLKESEAALVQSEKMSSLGQMIAGVAHEINTPLAYVRNGLQVLDEQISQYTGLGIETRKLLDMLAAGDADEEAVSVQYGVVHGLCNAAEQGHGPEALAGVIRDGIYGIEQISEIVTNLKNFSRLDRSKVAHFSLNEGLDSTLVIARNLVKTKQVEKDYCDAAFVTGSPSQINQVFLNLISNAAQATGVDGVINLRTRIEGKNAVVEVTDNGSGIPADVLPKIFDPFFTTKKIGEGTGLGLSIAYKIINEHGGRIEVASEVGKGTRFTITLPVDVMNTTAGREPAHAA
ncbi:DAHL domain-containing protein [Polaromonas sp.]|uniref:DAHL domain-containing protein n=1 Tax=Polaromonas sp. TaxID=1869339 RepID=UPI003263ED61